MKDLVTLAEAAVILGFHKDTIRKQILAGTCKYPAKRDAEGRWHVFLPSQNLPQNSAELISGTAFSAPTRDEEGTYPPVSPGQPQDALSVQPDQFCVTADRPPSEANFDDVPLWEAIGEQTDLIEKQAATLAEQNRMIETLQKEMRELLGQHVELLARQERAEEAAARLRTEVTQIGYHAGYYRREERGVFVGESGRARPVGIVAGFMRRVTG